jgi:EpsI family protein
MTMSSVTRSVILTACLVVGAVYLAGASESEHVPLRLPLSQLPTTFGGWKGVHAGDLEPEVLSVLGVDEYVNRIYRAANGLPVGLYIGYYQSQRQGESMHSPLNCLPGSGWQPISNGRQSIQLDGVAPIEVNRYVVQKAGENMLVLYWYQSHGRVVASEYWGMVYMVADAIRMNRTDAALVRVVIPIGKTDATSEHQAEEIGAQFVRTLFPLLERHFPV